MDEFDLQWSVSNPGPETLLLWLEPWAEQFEVPCRSTVALSKPGGTEEAVLGEAEWADDHLVFWASMAGTLKVLIDGELQESASALVPISEELTKEMLNVLFAGQPDARLGGKRSNVAQRASWWQRARIRLSL